MFKNKKIIISNIVLVINIVLFILLAIFPELIFENIPDIPVIDFLVFIILIYAFLVMPLLLGMRIMNLLKTKDKNLVFLAPIIYPALSYLILRPSVSLSDEMEGFGLAFLMFITIPVYFFLGLAYAFTERKRNKVKL